MLLGSISGWIAAVVLIFNFGTCMAMPWAKKCFEECDDKGRCHTVSLVKYHKPFVILGILAIIAHIIFISLHM